MRAFHYTEHIERPREGVFAYMMDFSTAPRWRNMVRRIEVIGGGPVQAGSKPLFTMDVMGQSKQGEVELWCYEPPRRFGQTNTRSGITGVFEYVLEPNGTGTQVSFTGDVRPHNLMWLLLPWVLASSRRRFRGQLAALKRAIEQKSV
ncbi:MAG TPA: SRPBCC family protein [Terriglobales bacterium]|nr:SRPBCC family protein [Terriglobales bacterium]